MIGIALCAAVGVTTGTSSAQESAPEQGEIRNGTAKAVAMVSRIGPGVGDLELAMRGGIAVTQVTNSLAQATSQTLDLGLIGSSLTAENCRGSQTIHPEDLPQPTFVDNRGGDTRASRDESQTEGSPFGLGRMDVEATARPVASEAVTTTNGFDLSPALRFGNGRASAATEVLPGEGRQAVAEAVSSLDLGGAVSLEGMRWRAFHRTGRDPHAEASFDVGQASIGGAELPVTDTAALEDAVNQALAPLGMRLRFPTVERFVEPTDLVRVGPLRLEIRDSPAGATIFGPVLDATRDGRGELFDTLSEQICDTAALLLVGDVVLSVVAGTGFLTLEFGGAEAASSDFELRSPFGAVVPPALPVAPPSDVPIDTGDVASPLVGGPTPGASDTAPPSASTELAVPASSPGPLEELCESIHPNGGSCSEGAAVAVGLLALLGTVGVAGADVFRQRRSRATEGS